MLPVSVSRRAAPGLASYPPPPPPGASGSMADVQGRGWGGTEGERIDAAGMAAAVGSKVSVRYISKCWFSITASSAACVALHVSLFSLCRSLCVALHVSLLMCRSLCVALQPVSLFSLRRSSSAMHQSAACVALHPIEQLSRPGMRRDSLPARDGALRPCATRRCRARRSPSGARGAARSGWRASSQACLHPK